MPSSFQYRYVGKIFTPYIISRFDQFQLTDAFHILFAVAKILRPHNLIDLNIAVRSKCQDFLLVSYRQHLCVSEADDFAVSYCRHMKIVGYWIGPDIEDGCGFVEATLTETFW